MGKRVTMDKLREVLSGSTLTDKPGAGGQPSGAAQLTVQNGFALLNRYRGAIMGFAALWIFFFHEWQPIFEGHVKIFWVESFIKKIGFGGVDIFLFLSGMGLTYSVKKSNNILVFYYKRIKRILLPFVFVALLHYRFNGWSAGQLLQNVLCIGFYRTSIYVFLWFVPAILTFYLFFPFYYRLFIGSSGKVRFTLCALVVWLLCTLFASDSMRYDLFGFTNRIPIFLIGILAGWIAQNGGYIFDRLTWSLLILVLFLGLYLAYLSGYRDMYILVPISNCCIPNILISVSLPFLLARFLFTLEENRYLGILGKCLTIMLSFFGIFSFEFYCIQEWLGDKVLPRILLHYSNLFVNVYLFSATTVTALIMYYLSSYFWVLAEKAVKITGAPFGENGDGR